MVLACKIHKHAYQCRINDVLNPKSLTRCPVCKKELDNSTLHAFNDGVTKAYVGQTTPEGHLILEHVGYRPTATDIRRGVRGGAVYRYKCANCGNTDAVAKGEHLKRPKMVTNCSACRSSAPRESINSHLRDKEKAMSSCQLYVSSVYFGDYIKIGISKDYDKRSAAGNKGNHLYDKKLTPEEHYKAGNVDLSYEDCYFLSPPFPRAWVFSILMSKSCCLLPNTLRLKNPYQKR